MATKHPVTAKSFNRDSTARFYAKRHLDSDPGTRDIYYLPVGAPEREIRFLEINDMIPARENGSLEPLDFGVDIDSPHRHTLFVLDVTPAQWNKIQKRQLPLPNGWSLDGNKHFTRR
jgi:hypothetical protein